MNITVIGAGYVGLVTAACLAETGCYVTCYDIDELKITKLHSGEIPIYEPGLDKLIMTNLNDGHLNFTSNIEYACDNADVYYLAVGTPSNGNGGADLSYIFKAARSIGEHMTRSAIIVDKSTVPVGTADKIKIIIQNTLDDIGYSDCKFTVVSNPEFLKEGDAINDFMKPDRIIIGTDDENAIKIMKRIYAPFCRNKDKMIIMGVKDAEMTKYTANAMLATKISFMNEISNICERLNVDVENVRKGIGSDSRIGYNFIFPGCGYGGSCFPKDVRALIQTSKENDFYPELLIAVDERNNKQKNLIYEKVKVLFPELEKVKIAVWGLSFKPHTDDMREAPSINLITDLLHAGVTVQAYDPIAIKNATAIFEELRATGKLHLYEDQYSSLKDANCLIILTEWKQFQHLDIYEFKRLMNQYIIIDGRNIYDINEMIDNDIEYYGIGRHIYPLKPNWN